MKKILMLALLSGLLLASCVEYDNPVVPSAVDDGAWVVPETDADPTVRPGDDFFMHCNGNWWKQTDLGDREVTGFLHGTVSDALDAKIATLDLPSLPVMERHAASFSLDGGEDAKALDELLRPLMEATTLEDAWLETGRLMARGGSFGLSPLAVNIDGKLYFTITLDISLALPFIGDGRDWRRYDIDPDRLARMVPITGSATRSVETGGEWPMLVAWFKGLGIDPAYGLTDAEYAMASAGNSSADYMTQEFRKQQEMDLNTYKENISSSVRQVMTGLFSYKEDEKAMLAANLYRKFARYESSRAMTEKYVTVDMCQRTLNLCHRIREAFADRIRRNAWLSEASKTAALDKLFAMTFNVGGPREWIAEGFADLSASKSLMEDVLLLNQAKMNVIRKIAGQLASQNAFTLLTASIASLTELNSSYMPSQNAMFIYPAFMMEPFWPADANEAFIYAGAVVIGHEITHGFDAVGYQYNKYGSYGPIFTSEDDLAKFTAFTKRMTEWYSSLEVMPEELPGLCNNGERTLAENIADLGGFEIAFEAYTQKLREDGFKGEGLRLQQQRFYQAHAYIWKTKYTAEHTQTMTIGTNEYGSGADNHSLARERVNGVVANTEAWYDLFDIKPGDKFYRAPDERIHIW